MATTRALLFLIVGSASSLQLIPSPGAVPRAVCPSRRASLRLAAQSAGFVLPALNEAQLEQLARGERCQQQDPPRAGSPIGSGFSVQDVAITPDRAWLAVSAFGRYADLIGTVRTASRYEPDPAEEAASCYNFLVSRIRLVLNVRFRVDESSLRASWVLDRPSWVLQDSSG